MRKTGIILLAGQAGSGKDTVGNYIATKHGAVTLGQADPMKRFAHAVFGFSEEQLWGPSEMRNAPDPRFARGCSSGTNILGWVDRNYCEFAEEWIEDVLPELDIYEQDEALGQLDLWIESIYDRIDRGEGLTPRLVLQTLGTEWGRQFSRDMWVDYAIRKAQALLNGPNTYDRTRGLIFSNKPTSLVVITDGRFRNEMTKVRAAGGIAVRILRPDSSLSAAAESGGVMGHASERELAEIGAEYFDAVIENLPRLVLDPETGENRAVWNEETLADLYLTTDLVLSRFYAKEAA